MKCPLCSTENCACPKNIGLLLIRLIIGIVFVYHGWAKITNLEGTLSFFTSIGLGNITLVYLAAYGELIGGILFILGACTKYAALVLVIITATAIATVHFSKGFSIMQGGYEYVLVLLVVSAAVGLTGAGRYSIDAKLKRNQ